MSSFISHINKDRSIQTNEEHSKGVALLAEKYTSGFRFKFWGNLMGMLHDKGKEQELFQKRIKRASGLEEGEIPQCPHAWVGAIIAKKLYPNSYPFVSRAILGHHAGLSDYPEFDNKMEESLPSEVDNEKKDCEFRLEQDIIKPLSNPLNWNHIQRMLYSCLVDADFLDTEAFMQPESAKLRGSHTPLKDLLPKLDEKLSTFKANTEVNKIRKEILSQCIATSECAQGFYSMTVPTGGGKTLASMAWALRHAIYNEQKRIIIAIPYTSIIVQTAAIMRSIFGEENVLEHHSSVAVKDNYNEDDYKAKLATENWDYPIVVTTNVQLLESMFSNKPSHCRKLHNISNSVIIMDEVQTLPTNFLQPIIDALVSYNQCFNTSFLFTTASMPVLSKDAIKIRGLKGIDKITEIIPMEMKLQERLKRVDIEFDEQAYSYDDVAKELAKEDKVLCIVNTRNDAREIYTRLPQEGRVIHLSRMMCPAHVMDKINEIKELLKKNDEEKIRVVSTQLIEAGVDIDFPCVYRQKAGLDSILQAAGRCNREGNLSSATTHVFTIEGGRDYGFTRQTRQATDNVVTDDYQSQEAMSDYFNQLYSRTQTFDEKDICGDLNNHKEMQFETAAENFKLIDETGFNVIVDYKDSFSLVEKVKQEGPSYILMKKLRQYTVNVREKDFKALLSSGSVEEIIEGIYVLTASKQYDKNIGLVTENKWLEETYLI